jgi:transcriptional regulator with XRE-family HTH domain
MCDGRGYREYSGDELRARRKKAGLGLRELARRGKVTAAYLCDVELNRRGVSPRIKAIYDREAPAR